MGEIAHIPVCRPLDCSLDLWSQVQQHIILDAVDRHSCEISSQRDEISSNLDKIQALVANIIHTSEGLLCTQFKEVQKLRSQRLQGEAPGMLCEREFFLNISTREQTIRLFGLQDDYRRFIQNIEREDTCRSFEAKLDAMMEESYSPFLCDASQNNV